MPSTCHREIGPDQPMVYQIRLKGQLDARWTDWFGGMAVALTEDGHTLLTGPVADQAALHVQFVTCPARPVANLHRTFPGDLSA